METASYRDWSTLPGDVLLTAMASMEVLDIIHSGAVCSAWRAAYTSFRALRLPTPRQPPCLLYYRRNTDGSGIVPTLYCPSTNATIRVASKATTVPQLNGVIGSAHGWLFSSDEKANPYLINPITGARATLPPITTLHCVKGSFLDDHGGVVYNVECGSAWYQRMEQVSAQSARTWMYYRVTVSGSPLAAARGGTACIVLLTHMPCWELSFARPGDTHWKLLSVAAPESEYRRGNMFSSVYNDKDGLFYTVRKDGSVHSLDLNNDQYPVIRLVKPNRPSLSLMYPNNAYLAITSRGSLLLVTRFCGGPLRIFGQGNVEGCVRYHCPTTGVQLEEIDVRLNGTVRRMTRIKDGALFLGRGSALCLPIKDSASSMLKQNCAYLTDDANKGTSQLGVPKQCRDLAVWDFHFQGGTLQNLDDLWPLHSRLHCPAAIWFTPSFCYGLSKVYVTVHWYKNQFYHFSLWVMGKNVN